MKKDLQHMFLFQCFVRRSQTIAVNKVMLHLCKHFRSCVVLAKHHKNRSLQFVDRRRNLIVAQWLLRKILKRQRCLLDGKDGAASHCWPDAGWRPREPRHQTVRAETAQFDRRQREQLWVRSTASVVVRQCARRRLVVRELQVFL